MRDIHQSILLAPAAMVLIFAVRADAGPASRASLTAISSQADAIVVGSVDANRSNGIVSANIVVDRTLKGAPEPGAAVAFTWADPQWGAPDERFPKDFGIFFLKKVEVDGWNLLPFTTGDAGWADAFVPVPPDGPSSTVTGGGIVPRAPGALEKVIAELVNAAIRGKGPPIDLVNAYHSTKSPTLEFAFGKFSGSNDRDLQALGLRGLLAMGDPSALNRLHDQPLTGPGLPLWTSTLQELKTSYPSSDASSLSSLGAIVADAKAPHDLRSAAAWALARLHVRAAMPYLAHALQDPDIGIEAAGVGGLSSFANNVPVGSHEPALGEWKLRTNDTIAHSAFDERIVSARQGFYVDFWKAWWAENQNQLP